MINQEFKIQGILIPYMLRKPERSRILTSSRMMPAFIKKAPLAWFAWQVILA